MMRRSLTVRSASSIYEAMPRYPTLSVLGALRFLDYLGTAAFAVGGSMVAVQTGLTVTGTVLVGTVTALGGGLLRDLTFEKRFFVLDEREYLYIAMFTSIATFLVADQFDYPFGTTWNTLLWFFDSLGLAAFSVIGTMFGVRLALGHLFTLCCTLLTCTGGGIIRDVLCRRPIRVITNFHEAYAETTLFGGGVYLTCRGVGMPVAARAVCGVSTTFWARYVAAKYDVRVPCARER